MPELQAVRPLVHQTASVGTTERRRQVNRNAQRARQIERLFPAPLKNKVQELSTNLLNLFKPRQKVLPIPMSNCSGSPALL